MESERALIKPDLSVDKSEIRIPTSGSAAWRTDLAQPAWLFFYDLENDEPAPFGEGAIRIGPREEIKLRPTNFKVDTPYRYCVSSHGKTNCFSELRSGPPPVIIIDDRDEENSGA